MPGVESGAAAEEFELFASKEQIDARIGEMADEVIDRYADEDPLFVCLLRGGVPATSKLMFAITEKTKERDLDFKPKVDYMTISTYGKRREAREPRIVMDLSPTARTLGRLLIPIDDVLDEGHTMTFADKHLRDLGAADVHSIALVEKENERTLYERGADIVGFYSPAKLWLRGMGMDDAPTAEEDGRWDENIYILNKPEA